MGRILGSTRSSRRSDATCMASRDARLTEAEWQEAITFLTDTGRACSGQRQGSGVQVTIALESERGSRHRPRRRHGRVARRSLREDVGRLAPAASLRDAPGGLVMLIGVGVDLRRSRPRADDHGVVGLGNPRACRRSSRDAPQESSAPADAAIVQHVCPSAKPVRTEPATATTMAAKTTSAARRALRERAPRERERRSSTRR